MASCQLRSEFNPNSLPSRPRALPHSPDNAMPPTADPHAPPSPLGAAVHGLKVRVLGARRLLKDALDPRVIRHAQGPPNHWPTVAESRCRVWTTDAVGEWRLEAGKVENLRVAARRLDGVCVPAGAVFSLWKHLGRPVRGRGFVQGRELLQGCVVPSVGGGLCQLSNALYDAASRAGFEVVERHRHSKIVAGSMADEQRDATLFWPHIDLRFKHHRAFRIAVELTPHELIVRLNSAAPGAAPQAFDRGEATPRAHTHLNCLTCARVDCFRHAQFRALAEQTHAQTAFLLDAYWPEFEEYIARSAGAEDIACVPVPAREPGAAPGHARYAWRVEAVGAVHHVLALTALRGLHTRALGAQGAARQRAMLDWDRIQAELMAHHLGPRVTRVVVSQNLLPFLWQAGHLRGRHVEVLMTRTPMAELHRRLEAAARLHPLSPTLGDFRAPPRLVQAESAALAAAARIVTPHSALARLFPHKTTTLDWAMPAPPATVPRAGAPRPRPTVVMPASTVGRKGAYELRAALDGLDIRLKILGQQLEGRDFWAGYRVERCTPNWLEEADLVVLPAHIEHQPRILLAAVAAGVPVIASQACGLARVAGVREVEAGDVDGLRAQLRHALKRLQ